MNILQDIFKRPDGQWRIDIGLIYPPFLATVVSCLEACEAKGARYYPTKGTRTFKEQDKLYQAHLAKKAGKPVPAGMTGSKAAPPGYSAHQFGCAIDFAPDDDLGKAGLQANYSLKMYATLIEECENHGLVNGHTFNDAPHVQIPRFVSGSSMATMRGLYIKSATGATDTIRNQRGLESVWAWLDKQDLWNKTP